ncbi:MAG: hypothetical protein AAFO17_07325 [Pseudomonadota bacterium]
MDSRTDSFVVATRAALKKFDGISGRAAYLTEAGLEGLFVWESSDLSAQVTADFMQAIYVPPISDATGVSGAWIRQFDGAVLVRWFGVIGDGLADDTAAVVAALNAVDDGDTLDLQGLHLNVFVGLTGVSSGDATTLSGLPRLFGKRNVTIQNGKLTADSPGPSNKKMRYPSTLTIDGCENVTLRNLVVHSKGENYGDTDASRPSTAEGRRAFAAQNGGHAIVVIRSLRTNIENCQARLCGSVGSIYIMSSHETKIDRTFSNPGSFGYASFAFDSWAGNSNVSGFAAHASYMTDCSTSKEGYNFGNKGCVLTEDVDVSVTVNGGYFADAYPNGTGRDLGYAFGASSSKTIVTNVVVHNCASVGYTGTTKPKDYTFLKISNACATGLRKTVHQTKQTAIGRMYWEYASVTAEVVGGGTWADDGNLSREVTSYLAMSNGALRVRGSFSNCHFDGATYGIVSDHSCFGRLHWRGGTIETNGFLWNSANIGGGSPGFGLRRGIQFSDVAIRDISRESGAYCTTVSSKIYTYIDLSTSTVELGAGRSIETHTIASPSTFVECYSFPRPRFGALDLDGGNVRMTADAPEHLRVTLSAGSARSIGLLRPDTHKGARGKISNVDAKSNLHVADHMLTNVYLTLAPGESAQWFNDGKSDYVMSL